MNALKAGRTALAWGLVLAALACGSFAWRYPTFFAGGFELLGVALSMALTAALLATVIGLIAPAPRLAAALGLAPLCAALAVAAIALERPVVTPTWLACAALAGAGVAIALSMLRVAAKPRFLAVATALVAATAAIAHARRPPPITAADERPKVFVFGLDAGTWTILDELMAADQLPALRRLREEGASGVLRSEVESASPRVWTTIATGKVPAKHGVVDFFCTQNQDLKSRRIWEILQARQSWSVGLFQWLVTWPPDPFDPFVVPAWMARGPETHPAGLTFIKQLEIAFQNGEFEQWRKDGDWPRLLTELRNWGTGYLAHGLRWKTAAAAAAQAYVALNDPRWELQYAAKRTLQLLLNGDVYLELYRRHQPDFSCFICYGTDNLAHKFWQYHYPDDFGMPHSEAAPYARLVTDYYRACDALLAEMLPLLSPSTTVAVVSDHGFTSVGEGGESHQRELRPKMSRIASELGMTESEVVWSSIATRGYFRPTTSAAGAAALSKQIIDWLDHCDAIGGAKVFLVDAKEDGQIEVAVNNAAAFERDTPIATPTGQRLFGDLVDIEDRTGNHSTEGIVILRGPAFRRGVRIEPARLADITPTLLHLHGLAVGADMDGWPIEEAFTEEFRASHEIERTPSWDDLVEVTRQDVGSGDDSAMRSYMNATGYISDDGDAPAADKLNQPTNQLPKRSPQE